MVNELITVPSFEQDNIDYAFKFSVRVWSDYGWVYDRESTTPVYFSGRYGGKITLGMLRTINSKLLQFYSQFVFRKIDHKELELNYLFKIRGQYPELNWDKFISKPKSKGLVLERDWFGKRKNIVEFISINPAVVSYLEQKVGDKIDLDRLKKMFIKQGNCSNLQDYCNKKAKYLMSLDGDSIHEQLKKPVVKEGEL